MGELKEQQDELELLKKENVGLKRELYRMQRAFLLQQRELNVLQLEKIDAAEAQLKA